MFLQRKIRGICLLFSFLALAACGGGESTLPVTDEMLEPSVPMARQRAMDALEDLDHYLGLAGIDESGTFFSTQIEQVNWLYSSEEARQDTEGLMMVMAETVLYSIMAAAYGDIYLQDEGIDPQSLSPDDCIAFSPVADYCPHDAELRMAGTDYQGQDFDIVVGLTYLSSGLENGQLDFDVVGEVVNSTSLGLLSGDLAIDFNETDTTPFVEMVELIVAGLSGDQTVSPSPSLLEDLAASLETMVVTVDIDGQGFLSKVGDSLGMPEFQSYNFTGAIEAWGELNMNAIDLDSLIAGESPFVGTEPFFQFGILSGELLSPEGDYLYGPLVGDPEALYIGIADESEMLASFGFEAFGMPEIQVSMNGGLAGLGGLVGEISSLLQLYSETGTIEEPDASLIADLVLDGSARLHIPDDGKTYNFELDQNRLDVQDEAYNSLLTFVVTGLEGGNILVGDELIATVSFDVDMSRTGFSIDFVDPEMETRIYDFGAVDELFEPELLMLLSGFLESLGGMLQDGSPGEF